MYLIYEWNWQAAYDALQKAIRLNPAAAGAYQMLALYYIFTGKIPEAVKVMEQAAEMDPLSPPINHFLAETYFFAERYDDAMSVADKLLEINPQMRITIETKGWCIGMKGNWEKAAEYFMEVHRLTNHPLKGLSPLGYAYAKLGQTDKALDIIAKLEQRQKEEPGVVIDGDILGVWWALGNKDKVLYYLEKCIEKRMGPVTFFLAYPPMKGITDDSRAAELIEAVQKRHT